MCNIFNQIFMTALALHLVFCRFYCWRMKDIEKAFAYISWKKKNICIHFPQFWISNLNVSFHELWPNILEEVEEKDKNHISFHVFCINVFCIHVLCILFLLTWLKYEIRSSCFFMKRTERLKEKEMMRFRLGICRDRRDWRSCKSFVSCVNFSRKKRDFYHILQVFTLLCKFSS